MSTVTGITSARESEVPLKEVWAVWRRQKWLVLIVVGAFVGLAAGYAAITEPVFRVTTRLQVSGRNPQFPGGGVIDPVTYLSPPSVVDDVPSQIEVLRSGQVYSDAMQAQGIPLPPPDPTIPPDPLVDVHEVGFTSILEISVDSKNQGNATKLAGQLPVTYGKFLQDQASEQINNGIRFLDEAIKASQERATAAGGALQEFHKEHQLANDQGDAVDRTQRVSRALADLEAAQAGLQSVTAQKASILAQRKATPDYRVSNNEQSNLDQKSRLEQRLQDLQTQRQSLLVKWLPSAQQVKDVDAQITQTKQEISALKPIVSNAVRLRNPVAEQLDQQLTTAEANVQSATATVAKRQADYDAMLQGLKDFNDSQGKNAELTQKQTAELGNLQSLLRQRQDFALRLNQIKSPVIVITPPTPPLQVKPMWLLYIGVALVVGLLASIPLARFKEKRDDRILTTGEAYDIAGAIPLGHIPSLGGGARTAGIVKVDPTTLRFESFRVLRSNLLFAMQEGKTKTVLVTSTGRREGKTDLAYNLAVAMAIDGRKVLLVDANLRQSALHKRLGLNESPGLSEVLNGTATWEECVHPVDTDGLAVMTAGKIVEAPAELLSLPTMNKLHDAVKAKFDLVLFDGPSFVTPSDPQILSSIVDGTLYVVNVGTSRRAGMRYAMDLLRQAHANLLGVVYNKTIATGDNVPKEFASD